MLSGLLSNIDQYVPMMITGIVSAIAFGWRVERKLDIFMASHEQEISFAHQKWDAEFRRVNERLRSLESRVFAGKD